MLSTLHILSHVVLAMTSMTYVRLLLPFLNEITEAQLSVGS